MLRLVMQYVEQKVDARGCDLRELGHQRYVQLVIERLRDAIEPDDSAGEPPLLPIINRYKPIGTTAEVDFLTTRPTHPTERSQIGRVVLDTQTWERSAVFRLEQAKDVVAFYARNDHLGLVIHYEHLGVSHGYEPDFLVRLTNGLTLLLEIKGFAADQEHAKWAGAQRWVSAVNTWGKLGRWDFHVCRDPQLLGRELAHLLARGGAGARSTNSRAS